MPAPTTMPTRDTVEILRNGWNAYARDWEKNYQAQTIPSLAPSNHQAVRSLGDEWSVMNTGPFTYGIHFDSTAELLAHLKARILAPYLKGNTLHTLEIGPGGGRFTELLLNYSEQILCADLSVEMLTHLKTRFQNEPRVSYMLLDGIHLDAIPDASMDLVASFDCFVHIEPRQIYNYVAQFQRILKPGGTGIIHHANLDSEIGWQVFLAAMPSDLLYRQHFGTLSIMTPGLMKTFVERAGFQIVKLDCETLPRDCIAIFRKPGDVFTFAGDTAAALP